MSSETVLWRILGQDIHDSDEETFLLFSHLQQSNGLGICDATATSLDLSVAGQDFTIKQSPTILNSNRTSGTTGAVVWQVTPMFAEWLATSSNFLFQDEILSSNSVVLELGCGISGIIPIVLEDKVRKYVATDQAYVLKLLKQNLENNRTAARASRKLRKGKEKHTLESKAAAVASDMQLLELDWEKTSPSQLPQLLAEPSKFPLISENARVDAIFVCDCIFNEALIDPLVDTCVEISRVHTDAASEGDSHRATICVFAQQLRVPEVFERWLTTMMKHFHVWRVPDTCLIPVLNSSSGYTVHVGILK